MAFDQGQYANEYTKARYDRITFLVPKGKKKVIQAYADLQGKSVTQVVVELLETHCKLDLSKQDGG